MTDSAALLDVLETTGMFVLWGDETGTITRSSAASLAILGREPASMVGLDRRALVHPADRDYDEEAPPALGAPGPVLRRVRRWLHADGSWRWLESTPVDARADPRIGGFVSVFRDITAARLVRLVSETVQRDSGLEAAFASVAALLGDVLPHQTALLAVITPEGIRLRAVEGGGQAQQLLDRVLPITPEGVESANQFTSPRICTDVRDSPQDAYAAAIAPARAYATFPIRVGGQLVGSITLLSRSPAFHGHKRVAIVADVVEQTGGLLFLMADLERQRRVSHQLRDSHRLALAEARTDPLTGLANRRAWEEGLAGMIERAEVDGQSLTVVMIDLDGLKAVNDSDGHQAGDELLRSLGIAWRSQVRPGDLFARYGGDEFALALWGCPAGNAAEVVSGLATRLPEGCSVSAGIAAWDAVETPEHLLGRADGALYVAKRNGRGLTVLAGEQGEDPASPARDNVVRLPVGRSASSQRR